MNNSQGSFLDPRMSSLGGGVNTGGMNSGEVRAWTATSAPFAFVSHEIIEGKRFSGW